MQEKKQKKIKASGMPANFGDFLMALVYPANFPALGRGPFLALMQEKKQKKIKASGTPAFLAGCLVEAADLHVCPIDPKQGRRPSLLGASNL